MDGYLRRLAADHAVKAGHHESALRRSAGDDEYSLGDAQYTATGASVDDYGLGDKLKSAALGTGIALSSLGGASQAEARSPAPAVSQQQAVPPGIRSQALLNVMRRRAGLPEATLSTSRGGDIAGEPSSQTPPSSGLSPRHQQVYNKIAKTLPAPQKPRSYLGDKDASGKPVTREGKVDPPLRMKGGAECCLGDAQYTAT
jgi:hypothetical protein